MPLADSGATHGIDGATALRNSYRFELIFVDDGSTDETLSVLRSLTRPTTLLPFDIRFLSFSRNFGKEAALYAGLASAQGQYVATMDADLQDPPSLLPQMLSIIETGEYDNVATRRVSRKGEPPIRSLFAQAFYKIINRISDAEIMDGARDFRLMNRAMANAILSLGEHNRFSKGIYGWVGFKTKWLEYENVERAAGESSWSFWKLMLYAFEGITAFSVVPLQLASVSGLLLCLAACALLLFIIVRTIAFGDPVSGWPSTMCAIVFIGGIQLLCLGVIGQYLAKTYLEVKQRPHYIVREEGSSQCGCE